MKRSLLLVVAIAAAVVFAVSSPAQAGENLIKDGSFEEITDVNQFGIMWKNWDGWIYDGTAKFASSPIARTGKLSAEVIGDQGCKIRVRNVAAAKLDAGRYRVTVYIRGLSIGEGTYKRPMDFSVGYDNKFPTIKKNGTFGWTPVTYVFQLDKPIDNFRLFVGLTASGWLWIDDATLEKVGDDVAVTPEPVVGKEEAPIAPPEKVAADAVHCPECGYLNNKTAASCYACGHALASGAKAGGPTKVIADFEDGKIEPFSSGKITTENVPQGKNGLLIDKDYATIRAKAGGVIDWSGYDYISFDAYSPHEDPVMCTVEISDTMSRGYWQRVNYVTVLPPGKSTVTFPADIYVGEKSRPGRPLASDKITAFIINPAKKNIVIDNLRLERLDTAAVKFDGLQAFAAGPLGPMVMEGFQRVTSAMVYEPGRGFGWDKADLWKAFNVMQPDALYQTFICPRAGGFRVDVPNGKYHVIMNIDSPGGYWGEVQRYTNRKITANGKTVVDESVDFDAFKKRYYRNAHQEDLPGVDTFKQYVQTMFSPKEFDVDVTDGKISLGFTGQAFAISLSSLVIYPEGKAEQGRKFWDWVTQRRNAQFNDYFKQVSPKRVGAPAPEKDYTVFGRHFMQPVNAFDGPQEGEKIDAKGLAVTAAKGEEVPVTFSIQPGAADIGKIDVQVSDLAWAADRTKSGVPVPPLKSGSILVGWLDYRITRVTMEGTVYTVAPRYWHPAPAPAAAKVTRTFWLRAKVPTGAVPGPYQGTITIKPANGPETKIPLTITVLPFALDPITDVAVGPWGSTIDLPWDGADPKTKEWKWSIFDKTLDVLKEAGCTSFTGRPSLIVKAAGGKIELNTDTADKEMELIRAKGFDQLIGSYGAEGASLGYKPYGTGSGPDVEAAKAAGFASMEDFLKALWGEVDKHAAEKKWLPVAWNLCDEPIGEAIKGSTLNALAHRAAGAGLKYTNFVGETSMVGDDPKNPHYELVKAMPIPSLNLHDDKSLKVIKDAGNKFSFYNGGNRWTYGRYMKCLVVNWGMNFRVSWHYNNCAGDPYYALDCREDDYCWYNSDEGQTMVPAVGFLGQIMPGLNDYRYLTTLQRLLKEKASSPAAADAKKVYDEMIDLTPGKDRDRVKDVKEFDADRAKVIKAIESLMQ